MRTISIRRTIFLFFTALLAAVANAEDISGEVLPSDRDHLTVTISYDRSIPGKWKVNDSAFKMFKPGSGVSLGLDYMWLVGNNVFFEPGVRLYVDSYRYNNISIGTGSLYEPAITSDPPLRKTGLRLPVMAGYKFDIFKRGSLLLSTGVEPEFGFSAHTKVDEGQEEIFDENMYKTVMRRFDVSWDLRGAIIIDNFRVDITGAIGMLDVLKTGAKMRENRLSIGLGYVF